ncbi:MAG: glycosyltransferase [bacterium]|nr:glycosyltransferase [bacterium]
MPDESPGFFERNLEALAEIYPGAAKLIRSVQSESVELHEIPDGFTEDEIEAHWRDSAELHSVFRFAASPVAKSLFDRANLAELTHDLNRRLLLIEDDPLRFRSALEREDWTAMLRSERCLFVVTDERLTGFHQLFRRYPQIAQAACAVYAGEPGVSQETLDELREQIAQVRRTLNLKLLDLLDRLAARPLPPYPRTIRFFVPGHNMLQEACVQGCRAMGYATERLRWKSPLYRFIRSSAWISCVENEQTDAAILFNATLPTFTRWRDAWRVPLRAVSWFVDNPRRYVAAPADLEGAAAVGVFDKTYIPFVRELTDAPVVEARTGYCIDPSRAERDEAFEEIDLAFVGELGTRGFTAYEEAFQRLDPEWMAEVHEFLRQLDVTRPIDVCAAALDFFAGRDRSYRGAWVEFIENKATTLRRRFFLEALADRGLRVFGDAEWGAREWAGKAAACYAGKRIEYEYELPRLYASAKININIFHVQCVAAPNPRVYDVLACGGFLLSNYNPGLEDEFNIGEDLDVFHTRDELIEKVEYYLARPHERQAIARRGRARALAKCGRHDRIQTLLYALSLNSGDRHVNFCG